MADHGHSHLKQGLLEGSNESTLVRVPTSSDVAAKKASEYARWQLIAAMVFCVFFMIAEVVGGYLAKSLAIMTE